MVRKFSVLLATSVNQENGCIPTEVTHTDTAENRRAPIELLVLSIPTPPLEVPTEAEATEAASTEVGLLLSLHVNHGLTLVWLSTELRHKSAL